MRAAQLKRLLSNEAAGAFIHPVAPSETEYYQTVANPICLAQIAERHEKGLYASYQAFHADIELLISNAYYFNDEHSLEWVL